MKQLKSTRKACGKRLRDLQTIDYRDYKPNPDVSPFRSYNGDGTYAVWKR